MAIHARHLGPKSTRNSKFFHDRNSVLVHQIMNHLSPNDVRHYNNCVHIQLFHVFLLDLCPFVLVSAHKLPVFTAETRLIHGLSYRNTSTTRLRKCGHAKKKRTKRVQKEQVIEEEESFLQAFLAMLIQLDIKRGLFLHAVKQLSCEIGGMLDATFSQDFQAVSQYLRFSFVEIGQKFHR